MLKISELTVGYRQKNIFSGFTWELPKGRTVILGPNGAGKSTLMNCVAGLIKPKQGVLTIAGSRIQQRRPYFEALGWMPQHVTALPNTSCVMQVAYAGWLKGMPQRVAVASAHEALHHVGLGGKTLEASKSLSGGQLRRLGLAEALMGEPKLLVLDEPSVGLDPGQRDRFRGILTNVISPDVDCLVSTHQVDDIDNIFDHVAVLYRGEIVHQSSVKDFLALAPAGLDTQHAAEAAYRQFVPDED